MPQVTLPRYWLHPEGWFAGTVVKIEDTGGKFGPQIRWHFETSEKQVDEDGSPICGEDGEQLNGKLTDFSGLSASANSKKQSKLGKILLALGVKLPETPEEAAAMDDSWFLKLYGKKVMLKIVQETMDDGRVFANIFEYKPVGAVAGAKPAAKPAAKVEEPAADCPDPSYNHDLKQGDEGYDPFHSCPVIDQKKAA